MYERPLENFDEKSAIPVENINGVNREIFCEEQVVLCGKRQTILLDGKAKNLPVIIMFHGRSWGHIVYGEGYRDFYPKLSDHYILVW